MQQHSLLEPPRLHWMWLIFILFPFKCLNIKNTNIYVVLWSPRTRSITYSRGALLPSQRESLATNLRRSFTNFYFFYFFMYEKFDLISYFTWLHCEYRISSYSCRGNYSFLNSSSEETIRVFLSLM